MLFKYQLPGEDLDALISVTNEDDLEHMMHEYDRLLRTSSSKPARMRLFLFPSTSSGGFGSEGSAQSDRDRFVEALNTTTVRSRPESEKSVTAPTNNNADFLFGSENTVSSPPPLPPPQPPHEVKLPVQVAVEPPLFNDPRVIQPEFQRMQEQQQNRRRSGDDAGGYFSPTYAAQNPTQPPQQPPTIPLTNQQAPLFWQGNNNNPGGVFPTTTTAPGLGLPEQPVYMIPSPTPTPHPGSVYHAPQPQPQGAMRTGQVNQGVMRPVVTGQVNQGGYYTYREQHQPAYNVAQPPVGVAKAQHQQQQPPAPPQQQYSAVPPPQQVVGLADTRGYTQVTYAGGMGKQVYYTEAPPPPQPQYHGIGLTVTGGMSELRTGPDGKLVAMNMAPKVSSHNSDSAV